MGLVARGERDDGVFEQAVAIKLMRGSLTSVGALERFLIERRILGRLVDPGIARILDGGSLNGTPWLAMDLIEGRSITEYANAAALNLDARLALFQQACAAVVFAHRNLVIHADIKPSNIMVDADGKVKLLDFGIARLIDSSDNSEDPGSGALTRQYAAPERISGVPASVASDVYGLGMVLRELVGPVVEDDLGAIIAHATAANPLERYPDVPSLLADLDARAGHRPISARPTPWHQRTVKFFKRQRIAAAVGALLIAAAAISTVQYVRAERARDAAESRFYEVRDLARFMLFPHYDRLADAPGTTAARAELAETAGRYLDRLAQMRDAPEDLRLDTARGFRRLATVMGAAGESNLGRTEEAKALLDRADATLATISGEGAAIAEERGWVNVVRWNTLADDTESQRVSNAAEQHFGAALATDPTRMGARLGLLQVEKNRGYMTLWNADRPADAAKMLEATLGRLRARAWTGEWTRPARALEYVLLAQIGDSYYYAEDVPASLTWFRRAEALVDAELARNPTQVWWDRYGDAQYNLSGSLMEIPAERGAALAAARRGREAMEARLALGFDETIEKRLTSLLGQESLVLEQLGQIDAALARQQRYIAIREARLRRNPTGQQANRDMAVAYTALAEQLARNGREVAACSAARRGDAVWATMLTKGWLTARDTERVRSTTTEIIRKNC